MKHKNFLYYYIHLIIIKIFLFVLDKQLSTHEIFLLSIKLSQISEHYPSLT